MKFLKNKVLEASGKKPQAGAEPEVVLHAAAAPKEVKIELMGQHEDPQKQRTALIQNKMAKIQSTLAEAVINFKEQKYKTFKELLLPLAEEIEGLGQELQGNTNPATAALKTQLKDLKDLSKQLLYVAAFQKKWPGREGNFVSRAQLEIDIARCTSQEDHPGTDGLLENINLLNDRIEKFLANPALKAIQAQAALENKAKLDETIAEVQAAKQFIEHEKARFGFLKVYEGAKRAYQKEPLSRQAREALEASRADYESFVLREKLIEEKPVAPVATLVVQPMIPATMLAAWSQFSMAERKAPEQKSSDFANTAQIKGLLAELKTLQTSSAKKDLAYLETLLKIKEGKQAHYEASILEIKALLEKFDVSLQNITAASNTLIIQAGEHVAQLPQKEAGAIQKTILETEAATKQIEEEKKRLNNVLSYLKHSATEMDRIARQDKDLFSGPSLLKEQRGFVMAAYQKCCGTDTLAYLRFVLEYTREAREGSQFILEKLITEFDSTDYEISKLFIEGIRLEVDAIVVALDSARKLVHNQDKTGTEDVQAFRTIKALEQLREHVEFFWALNALFKGDKDKKNPYALKYLKAQAQSIQRRPENIESFIQAYRVDLVYLNRTINQDGMNYLQTVKEKFASVQKRIEGLMLKTGEAREFISNELHRTHLLNTHYKAEDALRANAQLKSADKRTDTQNLDSRQAETQYSTMPSTVAAAWFSGESESRSHVAQTLEEKSATDSFSAN